MPMPKVLRATPIATVLIALLLAGCESDRSFSSNPFAPAAPPPVAKPAVPAINMSGRWMLTSPDGGMCGMTFTAKSGGAEGNIAPEGGCPGAFFTSRHWAFDQSGLSIIDHKDSTLARLAAAGPGRFQGRAVSGLDVTLSR